MSDEKFKVERYGDPKDTQSATWEITTPSGLRVNLFFNNSRFDDKKGVPTVNWSACGSQSLEVTTEYAEALLFACELARKETKS